MAELTTEQLSEVRADLMCKMSDIWESCGLIKSDWQSCLSAIDTWIEDNKTSYLNSIPEPAKSSLSSKQKAWLFMLVAIKRYDIL